MNILMLVSTLLVMLAILTYGRLQTFLHFSVLQNEYLYYMETTHRSSYNESQKELYDEARKKNSTEENKPVGSGEKEKPPRKEHLNSMISLSQFLKPNKKEQESDQLLRELLKKLIKELYATHPFYKEIVEKRPTFIDEILDKISEVAGRENNLNRFKKKSDIATINLEDEELQEAYYHMLHGTQEKNEKQKDKNGYPSLLNFVCLEGGKKISIYLASKELLMAIYENETVVAEILEARSELYRQVLRSDDFSCEEASKKFSDTFAGHSSFGNEESQILDFNVSKTTPNQYLKKKKTGKSNNRGKR